MKQQIRKKHKRINIMYAAKWPVSFTITFILLQMISFLFTSLFFPYVIKNGNTLQRSSNTITAHLRYAA